MGHSFIRKPYGWVCEYCGVADWEYNRLAKKEKARSRAECEALQKELAKIPGKEKKSNRPGQEQNPKQLSIFDQLKKGGEK
jgi:hypothetical protein